MSTNDDDDTTTTPNAVGGSPTHAVLGVVVKYTLTKPNADAINRRRCTGEDIRKRMVENRGAWPEGAQAHIGNPVQEGDTFPMVIVRVWSPYTVNGQVFLDGTDVLWVMSASLGAIGEKGHWVW